MNNLRNFIMNERLNKSFYIQDALEVAPALLGKLLVRRLDDGELIKVRIDETEVYRGEEDAACHARFGKTGRSSIMYESGGPAYIYMIYGLHFLLNVVSGKEDDPQAVLIRTTFEYNGPARLTKALKIDKNLNGIDLAQSNELWIEDDGYPAEYITAPRVGIDYAAEPYKSIKWRYILKDPTK